MPSGETHLTLSLSLDTHLFDVCVNGIRYRPGSKGPASTQDAGAKISNSNQRMPRGNKLTASSVDSLRLNPQDKSSLLSCVKYRGKQ